MKMDEANKMNIKKNRIHLQPIKHHCVTEEMPEYIYMRAYYSIKENK